MANELALQSFRLKNFKAIRDSDVVEFTPLTVLIGDNGSGKSSLIEGLQILQHICIQELDKAMQYWRGFENIINPPIKLLNGEIQYPPTINGIDFAIDGEFEDNPFCLNLKINLSPENNSIFIESEQLEINGGIIFHRDKLGNLTNGEGKQIAEKILPGQLSFRTYFSVVENKALRSVTMNLFSELLNWQFVTLQPRWMGEPYRITRTSGNIHLDETGSNITEYLLDIMRDAPEVFDGIVETLQFVLPNARGLRPVLTSEIEQAVHLELIEDEYRVKGWLLSTGTLRLLALLALFRHPDPPPLIVIEEIENGLDPRAVHLIVEELRNLVESGRSQVIVTTHSPYLLDLLPLWSIVLVEHTEEKGPVFSRPDDNPALEKWAEKFGPGRLYTMQGLSLGEGG